MPSCPHPHILPPKTSAFLRTILANPAELTAWLVYADWLDEHDNPLQAEFLRLMVRRTQLRNTELEWYTVEERLDELRPAVLPPVWVEVFDRPKIEELRPRVPVPVSETVGEAEGHRRPDRAAL